MPDYLTINALVSGQKRRKYGKKERTSCNSFQDFKVSLAGFTHADISAIRLCECKKLLGMLANARHSCINAAKIKKASVKIKAE